MTIYTKPLRWGILGCGKIANTFARALQDSAACELHAVAARDLDRAQVFASEHLAARAYGAYEDLLADPEVDAVYIATIHPQHATWIARCAQAGKHVLCEKPLTMNLREAQGVAKLARDKRCLLREAFMYRHHPQTQQVVDLVEAGAIGKVRMIDAKFCFNAGECPESRLQNQALGGGGILDVGCYPMSFVRLIAGRAQGRLFAEPIELKAVGHLDMKTKVDMWTSAALRFEGDVLAKCSCATQMNAENNVVIYGELGRIEVESPWFCDGTIRTVYDDARADALLEPVAGRHLYAYEIESFAGELRGQPIGARAVGMRFDDSLGNMKALDWWRAEIGLAYEADR
jgi:predicted dehydrogenase